MPESAGDADARWFVSVLVVVFQADAICAIATALAIGRSQLLVAVDSPGLE